jgi:Family of unknown function (DUF6544)
VCFENGVTMTMPLLLACTTHGLIHLLGAAKGLRLARVPRLSQPISVAGGVVWLTAALLFFAAGIALSAWPEGWWMVGGAAILVSMVAIVRSWSDAKFGVIPNMLILAAVVAGFMSDGPFSLRAEYVRDVRAGGLRLAPADLVCDDELVTLPAPVRRYLELAGVVGQPRVQNFFVRMHGRIRQGPQSPWMALSAEQHNFIDMRTRHFYMTASMFSMPVRGYHRFADSAATMRVELGGLVPVAGGSGPEMTQAETVTFLNDMAVLAPATLLDPGIEWEPVNDNRAGARFTIGAHTIRADLVFSDTGELINFISDDRYQAMSDGSPARKLRWSTPLGNYRRFGNTRLASTGAGRWHDAGTAYSYIELTIDDVQYNVRHP